MLDDDDDEDDDLTGLSGKLSSAVIEDIIRYNYTRAWSEVKNNSHFFCFELFSVKIFRNTPFLKSWDLSFQAKAFEYFWALSS